MTAIFQLVFYQPLYNLLVFLYNFLGQDFGLAIIGTTLLLRIVLIPLSRKQIESQKKLQELQPKIKDIQEKHKNNKEQQSREMMQFYRENKINPFGGCLPLVIQVIFFIALYRILFSISSLSLMIDGSVLYSFVANPGAVNHLFLSFLDLSKPSVALAILAAAAQYVQTKMLMNIRPQAIAAKPAGTEPNFADMMNKQMLYLGPVLTLVIGIKFAAGLSLYWFASTVFMILQQFYLEKRKNPTPVA